MLNDAYEMAVHEKYFYLGTSECDINGLCKTSHLLSVMQNTSNEHAQKFHLWHSDLKHLNTAWVLFRTEMSIERYPELGEKIKVCTYTRGTRYLFCPRYFFIHDENGIIIARSGTLMMLIDRTTRKAVNPKEIGIDIPDAFNIEPAIKISMKSDCVIGEAQKSTLKVKYSDIDINGHVNNVKYIDWLCDSLGFETLRKNEIETFRIVYYNEVIREQLIDLKLIIDNNNCRFQLSGCSNNKTFFDIIGKLRIKTSEIVTN